MAVTLALLAIASCSKRGISSSDQGKKTSETELPRKSYDAAKLFSGVEIHASIESSPSGMTALETAARQDSYLLDLDLHIRWPKPATTVEDLAQVTPELPRLFPSLPSLLQDATPSPDFTTLQRNKEKSLRSNLANLQRLFYRDSLFDCQTILNIQGIEPHSPRALLIQAIMNVNADGSDGDRNLDIDKLSSSYQPQTNYRWHKSSDHPNPMLPDSEVREALTRAELGNGTLTPDQLAPLKKEHDFAQATVAELKRWSFLVGTADPFIVLPSFMVGKSSGQPSIGDYAVVIAHGILYPAIVGDLGPNSKIGEASLRICREIDANSGEAHRPASSPEIVYLVFPGSADKPFAAPNYKHWSERCRALWKSLGGSESAPWHEWTSLEKPWPTPTPEPFPTAMSAPSLPPFSNSTNSPSSSNLIGTNSASISSVTNTPPIMVPSLTPTPLPTSALPSLTPNQ